MSVNNRSKPTSVARLRKDYLRLKRDPVPYIKAEPLPQNILEWHYVVKGPESTPYYGGYYHGTLIFPREFPFKPPSIFMTTPNGRFKTNTRLCLSISDFHPDSWNPAWSVATILTGLLSFMLETTPTHGSLDSSVYEREQLARNSLHFNLKNETFKELFPDIVKEIQGIIKAQSIAAAAANDSQRKDETVMVNGVSVAAGGGGGGGGGGGVNDGTSNAYRLALAETTTWQSLGSNLLVLIGFAIFAFIVNHVIKSLNTD